MNMGRGAGAARVCGDAVLARADAARVRADVVRLPDAARVRDGALRVGDFLVVVVMTPP
jgi:hypothetical protein